MSGVWESLKPTTWYKAVMGLTGPAFLIALAGQRDALALIFIGAFFVALGEWKNHRKFFEMGRLGGSPALREDTERKTTLLGAAFQIGGGVVFCYGVWRALGFRVPLIDA
jgi:hypothetical protein